MASVTPEYLQVLKCPIFGRTSVSAAYDLLICFISLNDRIEKICFISLNDRIEKKNIYSHAWNFTNKLHWNVFIFTQIEKFILVTGED